jgi:16S rRNA (guanine527-N7)-methyltransferase
VTHPGVDIVSPPPPELARAVFGARLPLAERYAWWLACAGVERGLIGPREAERLWLRHLLNCAAVAALIPRGSHVVDLGSGAGLPGIVLAIARPDLQITLVEPMQRRITFLDEVLEDLALGGVDTRRASADELATAKLNAAVVTARAVAPVSRLASLAAPLLRVGGQLLAIKGSAVAEEVSAGWSEVQRAGMNRDVALLAIVAAAEVAPSGDAGLVSRDASLLPGVQVAELSTWRPDGSMPEEVAGRVSGSPPPTDPLALVLRLGQSGHRPSRRH